MKLKSLLAATSIVAFMAGSAHALEISNLGAPAGTVLANELDLAATPVGGNFVFDLTLTNGGQFPAGDNLVVDVTLPTGVVFGMGVTGASITAGADRFLGGANLQGGGTAGSSSAQFLVTIDPTTANQETTIGFNLPLAVNACPTAANPLVVGAALAGTNPPIFIEGDADGARSANLVSCESAKQGTVASDAATSDTIILLPDYNSFGPNGTLGTVNYTLTNSPVRARCNRRFGRS